jgi:uncharacterized membrane protein
MTAYGVMRRDPVGALAAIGGLTLVGRALADAPLKRLIGISAGARVVDVQKTMEIDAPIDGVFDLLSDVESLPLFMPHVRSVRAHSNTDSRWQVAGPLGLPISWAIHVTQSVPGETLAWHALPGSIVQHAGVAQFAPTVSGGTRLDIRVSYNPGFGILGHLAARLFGVDAKHILDTDLVQFKSLLEHGKTTAHGEAVTMDELAQIVPNPS